MVAKTKTKSLAGDALERVVDAKGRLSLGKEFANKHVFITPKSPTELLITAGVLIPEAELWLHRNPRAQASIKRGLEEASRGEVVEPPNLRADLDQISDERLK